MEKLVLLYTVLFIFIALLFPKLKTLRMNFAAGDKYIFIFAKDYILSPLLALVVVMRLMDSSYIFWGIISMPRAAKFISLLLLAVGLWLKIWSYKTLGKNWSAKIDIYDDHFLIKTGPNRWIRHPVYNSYLLTFTGSFLFTGDFMILAIGVLYFCFNVARAYEEENFLLGKFQEEFRSYQSRTEMFIPAIILLVIFLLIILCNIFGMAVEFIWMITGKILI